MSDIIYGVRGAKVSFTQNVSIITQLLNIFEFRHEDLKFEHSIFFRKQEIQVIPFFLNSFKSLKEGGIEKIGPFRWKLSEKLRRD